jgi:hypothetical protein
LREKLAGAADERDALRVFVGSGAFAYENQAGFGISYAEDDFRALFAEAAAAAI